MTKFHGNVGYVKTVETSKGVYHPTTDVKMVRGDVLTSSRRYETGTSVNDNVVLSSRLSLVSTKYMVDNLAYLKWVEYLGTKWKVTSIEVLPPRIILSLGGVYNVDDQT